MCTSCWHANGSNENTNTESTLWEREVIWITGDSKEMHNGYLFVLERISNECVNWKNDLHGRALHRIIELFPCLVASSYPRSTMRESHTLPNDSRTIQSAVEPITQWYLEIRVHICTHLSSIWSHAEFEVRRRVHMNTSRQWKAW